MEAHFQTPAPTGYPYWPAPMTLPPNAGVGGPAPANFMPASFQPSGYGAAAVLLESVTIRSFSGAPKGSASGALPFGSRLNHHRQRPPHRSPRAAAVARQCFPCHPSRRISSS